MVIILINKYSNSNWFSIKRINKIIDKRDLGFTYIKYLSKIDNIQTQFEAKWAKSVWMYGFVIKNKKNLQLKLRKT